MKKWFTRGGPRTRYNALNPSTGQLATCVKFGHIYSFSDGTTVYSWNIQELTASEYHTRETHKQD